MFKLIHNIISYLCFGIALISAMAAFTVTDFMLSRLLAGIAIISSLLLLRSVSPQREMINNQRWKSRETSN